ncbi:hypothetical protein [Streptomyces sp. NPDC014733]|uniref:hypothetical protein n=1 Tax=Streptomyces sp. NPDC014733 TaxID=3364885 RepID=UPI0036FCAE11
MDSQRDPYSDPEPEHGHDTAPDRRHTSVVQLICRAYGLADVSEITVEHMHRYVTERRLAEQRTHGIRGPLRPWIPRPRTAGDAG